MAGILDSKKRIMDTLITAPGRSQAADGHMQFRYVTFTDRHAFYDNVYAPTASNVADDAGDRLYFEAAHRFQDLITLETDLNGRITFENFDLKTPNTSIEGLPHTSDYLVMSGVFPTGSSVNPLKGGMSDEIVSGMTASYMHHRFLSTIDPFARNNQFLVSTSSLTFFFRDQVSAKGTIPIYTSLQGQKAIWSDVRFSKKPNFRFLPPINKLPPGATIQDVMPFIGLNEDLYEISYKKAMKILKKKRKYAIQWVKKVLKGETKAFAKETAAAAHTEAGIYSFLQPKKEHFHSARMCSMGVYDKSVFSQTTKMLFYQHLENYVQYQKYKMGQNLNWKRIQFTETSRHNNIMMQIFEFPAGENKINKLTIIDGETLDDNNEYGPDQHLFHVGKLYNDEASEDGDPASIRFVNIFSIILHSNKYERKQLEETVGNQNSTAMMNSLCNLNDCLDPKNGNAV